MNPTTERHISADPQTIASQTSVPDAPGIISPEDLTGSSRITSESTLPTQDLMSRKQTNQDKSISMSVYTNDLRGVVDDGFAKVGWLRRTLIRSWKTVNLEAADHTDKMFYAPDISVTQSYDSAPLPTHSVKVTPIEPNCGELVREGDNFEISFVGMSVRPHDYSRYNKNELLLYSLTKLNSNDYIQSDHCLANANSSQAIQAELANMDKLKTSDSWRIPTGISPRQIDAPFIHYDPVVDGHDEGTTPNEFIPVPVSGSLYISHNSSAVHYDEHCVHRIPIRFTLMEIDKVSDMQARTISGIDQIGNYVSGSAAVVPYLDVLTKAFTVASSLGKHGLKNYARPDHVLSGDTEFLLAKPKEYYEGRSAEECLYKNNYLRYGYYFFLSRPVDARLYTEVNSSDLNVPLLLKQNREPSHRLGRNERDYFALTGRSYVVMKVTRGCRPQDESRLTQDRENHRQRLENILHMSKAIEMLAGMKKKPTIGERMKNMVSRS